MSDEIIQKNLQGIGCLDIKVPLGINNNRSYIRSISDSSGNLIWIHRWGIELTEQPKDKSIGHINERGLNGDAVIGTANNKTYILDKLVRKNAYVTADINFESGSSSPIDSGNNGFNLVISSDFDGETEYQYTVTTYTYSAEEVKTTINGTTTVTYKWSNPSVSVQDTGRRTSDSFDPFPADGHSPSSPPENANSTYSYSTYSNKKIFRRKHKLFLDKVNFPLFEGWTVESTNRVGIDDDYNPGIVETSNSASFNTTATIRKTITKTATSTTDGYDYSQEDEFPSGGIDVQINFEYANNVIKITSLSTSDNYFRFDINNNNWWKNETLSQLGPKTINVMARGHGSIKAKFSIKEVAKSTPTPASSKVYRVEFYKGTNLVHSEGYKSIDGNTFVIASKPNLDADADYKEWDYSGNSIPLSSFSYVDTTSENVSRYLFRIFAIPKQRLSLTIYRYENDPEPFVINNLNVDQEVTINSINEVMLEGWRLFDTTIISGNGSSIIEDKTNDLWKVKVHVSTVVKLAWLKEFNNLVMSTSVDDPSTTVTAQGSNLNDFAGATVSLFKLADTTTTALPVGGHINIYMINALIQHNGSATNHPLSLAPIYISEGLNQSSSLGSIEYTTINADDFSKFKDFRRVDDSGSSSGINNPDSTTSGIVWHINQYGEVKTKTTKGIWTIKNSLNFTPQSKYSNKGRAGDNEDWFLNLTTHGSNDTWHKTLVWSETLKKHSSRNVIYANHSDIINNCVLATPIEFTRVTGSSDCIGTVTYDTVNHDISSGSLIDIPASIGGNKVDKLGFILIKRHNLCTVKWRLYIYRLVFMLS